MRSEHEYEEYRLRRAEQQRLVEDEMTHERIAREAKLKEY